jgi:hypothetical protein
MRVKNLGFLRRHQDKMAKSEKFCAFPPCYNDRVKRLGDNCRLAGNQVARPNILTMKEINI